MCTVHREHVKEEHEIVIIDNASPDGSGEALRQLYSDISNIKVIVNEGNLGYACGNNVGIARARTGWMQLCGSALTATPDLCRMSFVR